MARQSPGMHLPALSARPHEHAYRAADQVLFYTAQSAGSSVAASDSAKTPFISLDGDGPAAPADPLPRIPPIIIIVAVASVVALAVSRPTDTNLEARSFKVYALSQARRRGGSSRCADEPERNHRSRNQPHRVSFPVSPVILALPGKHARSALVPMELRRAVADKILQMRLHRSTNSER